MPTSDLLLYNSLSRVIEPVNPTTQPLTIYACGITPYDTTHIGHAFTYTSVDILIRYLEYKDYSVRYVQNVTDIDDDILKRAGEVGDNWKDLGDHWTTHFIRDMVSLNVRPPEALPRATDVISEIVHSVGELVTDGVGYVVDGNVYFDIHRFPGYGKLSGLSYQEMGPVAAERGNHPNDANKRDPLDFVLWQAQAADEPAWTSPWGYGRPGWHIECSTMARSLLGKTVDIHAGGEDLIFPHHESEIAQAEATREIDKFVRHWMHIAMVEYEGDKMSKSLGNLVMIRDLLNDWSADALRLYLASHHYRDVWTVELDDLSLAAASAAMLTQALRVEGGNLEGNQAEKYIEDFITAMDNDLNTTAALGVMSALSEEIIRDADHGMAVQNAQESLLEMGGVLGLRLGKTGVESRVSEGWAAHMARFQPEVSSGKE